MNKLTLDPALEKIIQIVQDLAIKEYPVKDRMDLHGYTWDANRAEREAYKVGALEMAKLVAEGIDKQ